MDQTCWTGQKAGLRVLAHFKPCVYISWFKDIEEQVWVTLNPCMTMVDVYNPHKSVTDMKTYNELPIKIIWNPYAEMCLNSDWFCVILPRKDIPHSAEMKLRWSRYLKYIAEGYVILCTFSNSYKNKSASTLKHINQNISRHSRQESKQVNVGFFFFFYSSSLLLLSHDFLLSAYHLGSFTLRLDPSFSCPQTPSHTCTCRA